VRFPEAVKSLDVRDPLEVIARVASREQLERISRLPNKRLLLDIAEIVLVAQPASIFVHTGSEDDREYVRRRALASKEEIPSKVPRHTVHFDGPLDLARDKANTRILVGSGERIAMVNTLERDRGLAEVSQLFRGVMAGREMFVGLYVYGPEGSPLSLYGVQVTDSAYVIHSEDILYRNGYRAFLENPDLDYMLFIHSAGERDERGWSKNVEKRRIYIDLHGNSVYSVNTQYAGNTVGLKKLALRLAVYKGLREGWLAEHMFIIGMRGPGGRVTYFTGAFPAGCGKTATTMIADTVVGDDLAIIREIEGEPRAINPEVGMFGIIDGVNPADDPEIYGILVNPEAEIIFCNVLLTEDGEVWWRGKPTEPRRGLNYAGEWWPGKVGADGREILPSHPNARFTVSIRLLEKLDPRIDDPMGVPVSGFIFGGRDPATLPPVVEAFSWQHGIVTMGAALESERTAAVLGETGVMELNPFAILDFLSISPGKFTELHLRFAEKLVKVPRVFQVNYFLRGKDGSYLAEKRDKIVWLRWMEHRVHGELGAIPSPIGYIPLYEDLCELFDKHLSKDFPENLYEEMFAMRTSQLLSKIERVRSAYEQDPDAPLELFEILGEQYRRVENLRSRYGDRVSPFKLDKR